MAPRHPTRGESGSHIVTTARGVGDLVKSGLVMFGLAWWMFAAGSVAACSCASLTDDEALAEADVAFVGTLQEIRVPDDVVTWSSDDPARFVFAVSAVYKGEAFEQQSVVTSRDGASCGLEVRVGQTALVFAQTDGPGLEEGEVASNLCSGTRSLGVAIPDSFGAPSAPEPGSSAIGSDGRWWLAADTWIGAAIVIAAIGLAGAGIVLGRRARRA